MNKDQRTLDGNVRTNNSVELWNGAIGTALGKHPNMWKLLGDDNDKAIQTIVSKYDDYGNKIDFLQKIGRHISTFKTSAILQTRE
jgi:hypothetical protein